MLILWEGHMIQLRIPGGVVLPQDTHTHTHSIILVASNLHELRFQNQVAPS